MMLDIGTRPNDYAIARLYKYMSNNPNCGGCCGEIEVDFSTQDGLNLSYFVKAAQFYEYKLSHSPDKACESFFGYNSVLPGAYCMFRWKAIQGGPMDKFFKLVNSDVDPSCGEANEYLAEDRVMCLQIYIKQNSGYYLTYVPDAKAYTDAPEDLCTLIKQRRRWMNGALFAAFRVINNYYNMVSCFRTTHPVYRQFGMFFYVIYFMIMQIFSFFMVGFLYVSIKLFFVSVFRDILDQGAYARDWPHLYNFFMNTTGFCFSVVFTYTYAILVGFAVLSSIAIPINRAMAYFRFLAFVFSVLTISAFVGIAVFMS